jgi:hypothetical protein
MAIPTSWLRVRHWCAVLALVVAPLLGVAWSFLVPLFRGSMSVEVAAVAADPGRFVAGTYLGVLMSFLMIPAALAMGRFIRPLAPVAGDVAAALWAAGACFHGGVLVFQLAEANLVARTPDQALATTMVSRLYEYTGFTLVLMPFIAFYVGLAALAVLLILRRAVPLWIPILILVSIPIELFAPILWKARLFFVLLSVAFAGLALAVRRVGAAEWARRADDSRDVLPASAVAAEAAAR